MYFFFNCHQIIFNISCRPSLFLDFCNNEKESKKICIIHVLLEVQSLYSLDG